MEVLKDGITVINRRRDKSSDLVRGKKGYHDGVHVFEVNWPTDERGSHPMIGVASVDTPISIADFTYLLGRTSDSWGWNLATKELFHDGKINGQYPKRNPDFEVPETFYIILNAEDGTLSFRTNFENLGVAFSGLPNQDKTHPLYVSASATFAFCRIRLKYKCSEGESDFTAAPLPTGHSYYKFNSENRGRFVVIEMRGRVAKKRSPNVDRDNSVVLTRQPLKFDEAFEVRLDSVHAQWTGNVEIGVTTNDPRKLAIPETMADCEVGETLLWSGDWLLVNGEAKDGVTMEEDLEDCTVGDRVGIVRRRDGCVQFLFNGRILESSIRFGKQSQDLYGVIDLYGKAGRVTIMESETAAARVTYDLTTSMREEFENNHPNAIMFRMRDIVDKIKCEQYTSLREELNDIASGILLPFYQSTDQNLRRIFGDHLASIGGAETLAQLLHGLMGRGVEDQTAWFGIRLLRSIFWTYSDVNFKLCQKLGSEDFLGLLLEDLKVYGSSSATNEKHRFLIISALYMLHNCAKASENRHLFRKLQVHEKILPFMRSDDMTVATVTLLILSQITYHSDRTPFHADADAVQYLLVLLASAQEDLNLCGKLEDGTFSASEVTLALGNIATNDSNILTIVQAGCIPLLARLLEIGGPYVQESVLFTLRELCRHEKTISEVSAVTGITSIIEQLAESCDESTRQAASMLKLKILPDTRTFESGGRDRCAYQALCQCFKEHLQLPGSYFDESFNICYCVNCHHKRDDRLYYLRGKPAKDYALPVGWCRFALKVSSETTHIFKKWHVAFYGTTVEAVENILKYGNLPRTENTAVGSNHAREQCSQGLEPPGYHTKQVCLSATIRYVGMDVYSKPHTFIDIRTNKTYKAKVAFQVCVKPGSYKVGQKTARSSTPIDLKFSNHEIEWSARELKDVVIYGLLVKLQIT